MPSVEIQGHRIHYELLGRGEPVALLNGVMMSTRSWVLQSSVLRRRYRCLLHDFRGQLLSDKPEGPWDIEQHADDLRELLDRLEIERLHLVGTSYGGEVGLIFAARWPERVESLTVISSVSEVGPELDRAVASWSEAALQEPQNLYRIAASLNFSPRFVEDNPELIEQGEERLQACPSDFFPAFHHLCEAFRRLDITDQLPRITCPTLVLVGELDALKPPRYSRLLHERIPDCELLLVPDAGHAVILERPREVNTALLGFLEKQRSADEISG